MDLVRWQGGIDLLLLSASAGVRARNPAAVSRDVVFPDPTPAQPATKSAVTAAAKMRMTFNCDCCVFIMRSCFK